MKDRLIELLENYSNTIPYYEFAENLNGLADHLLANGVIVPPVKVGQTVWFYKAELEEICSAKVVKVEENYFTPSMPIWITIQYVSKLIGTYEEKMSEEVFKLLCYKTREEAEKHLRKEVRNER